jgi:hypothetical protein
MVITAQQILQLLAGAIFDIFAAGLALHILVQMWRGRINLSKLISEPNGDASLSRLQFLIFTFVISLSLFLVIVGPNPPKLPSDIPSGIFVLLGISGSSYLVSKSIQFGNPAAMGLPVLQVTAPPYAAPLAPGTSVVLTAAVSNNVPGSGMPPLKWSINSPALGTITPVPGSNTQVTYTAPAAAVPPLPPQTTEVVVSADGYTDGVIKISI